MWLVRFFKAVNVIGQILQSDYSGFIKPLLTLYDINPTDYMDCLSINLTTSVLGLEKPWARRIFILSNRLAPIVDQRALYRNHKSF